MHIITLHENLGQLGGKRATKIVDGLPVPGTLFANPTNAEAPDVPGRRVVWIHDWTPEEETSIQTLVASLPSRVQEQITFTAALPADWRHDPGDPSL